MSTVLRKASDPEEDFRLMAQEVRDYVDAVLNSLSANVPKVSSVNWNIAVVSFLLTCAHMVKAVNLTNTHLFEVVMEVETVYTFSAIDGSRDAGADD